MVEVREVKTRKERKEFLTFPDKLYKGNKNYVPPLYMDEKQIFSKNYIYYDTCEAVYYNAYKDGKIVGRISVILQHTSNEKWNQKRVRFTRFDSINDQEVANALFYAVENYARSKGMEEVVGPLGFSDLEREGLLIEGFDELATYEEAYNYEYYKTLIENLGYVKEVDWEERELRYKPVEERVITLTDKIMKKYNLHMGKSKSVTDFLNRYGNQFFEILDKTYVNLYQTVPFTEKMKKSLISNFKLMLSLDNVEVICDENDKVVCFGLCLPSIAKAVNKSKGRLFPFGIFRLLKAIKKPKVIDFCLIGVLPEYQMKGVATVLLVKVMEMMKNKNIEHAETNLNLETNTAIINQWKMFDARLHKKRRSYVKKI